MNVSTFLFSPSSLRRSNVQSPPLPLSSLHRVASGLLLVAAVLFWAAASPVQAQEVTQSTQGVLVLEDGERISGTLRITRTGARQRIQRMEVGGTPYHPRDVFAYESNGVFYRVRGRVETVQKTVLVFDQNRSGQKTVEVDTVQFEALRRYREGQMDLYATDLSGEARPPFEYFSLRDSRLLYEVTYDNLARAMQEGSESYDALRASQTWRRTRNAALITGSGLAAWGLVRGIGLGKREDAAPGVQPPRGLGFEVNRLLVGGVLVLAGAYLLHRKTESAFWESIQRYNAGASGTGYRYPDTPRNDTRTGESVMDAGVAGE